jgi:hypothetical protein
MRGAQLPASRIDQGPFAARPNRSRRDSSGSASRSMICRPIGGAGARALYPTEPISTGYCERQVWGNCGLYRLPRYPRGPTRGAPCCHRLQSADFRTFPAPPWNGEVRPRAAVHDRAAGRAAPPESSPSSWGRLLVLLIPVFFRSRFRAVLVLEARWTAAPNEEDSRRCHRRHPRLRLRAHPDGQSRRHSCRAFAASANPRKGSDAPGVSDLSRPTVMPCALPRGLETNLVAQAQPRHPPLAGFRGGLEKMLRALRGQLAVHPTATGAESKNSQP